MTDNPLKNVKYIALFVILISFYLFSFCGISSTDDEQLYAVLTANLASGNGYSALPLFGNDRLQGKTGGVEPLHSLLGIPFYLLANQFKLGKTQILFLLPAIYTAITGVLLTRLAEIKGASQKASILLCLAFGLGTIAFPYARTNFREPLAAMLLSTALLCFELLKLEIRSWKKFLFATLCIIFLILSALTKITTAVLISLFLLAYLWHWITSSNERSYKNVLLICTIGIFTIAVFLIIQKLLPSGSLNRFTLRFVNYLSYTLPRLSHDHFWQGMSGLLISPGKGLFIYSPILFLLFVIPFTQKKNWSDFLFYISAPLLLTVVQALIYNEQWWNITWGTRALIPALPFAILATTPALDAALNHKKHFVRIGTFALLISGFFIQVGRLLTSDPVFSNWVVRLTGEQISAATQWDFYLTPLYRHWQLGLHDPFSDIAWLHLSSGSQMKLLLLTLLLSLLIIWAVMVLYKSQRQKQHLLFPTTLMLSTLVFTLFTASFDERYYGNNQDFVMASSQICQVAEDSDLILIDSYLYPNWWFYSNFGCSGPEWLGLPYIHKTAIGGKWFYPRLSDTTYLIQKRLDEGRSVFLIQVEPFHDLAYRQAFEELGFSFESLSLEKTQSLEILKIIN